MKSTSANSWRVQAIDLMRGLVMILMALDHTRDLFHEDVFKYDPTDLQHASPSLFLTRWITHLCAPTFVFLSGVSAFLSTLKLEKRTDNRSFFITRGLWLILLELTLVNFGIWFDIRFSVFLVQVIAAIGCSFLAIGLLLPIRPTVLGILGLLIIIFHQMITIPGLSPLFKSEFHQITPDHALILSYPPIPWLGIFLTGYGAGNLFTSTDYKRFFVISGAILLLIFLVLRYFKLYGDPSPWIRGETPLLSLLSFINVSKYPPSLHFCLLFLGLMALILPLLNQLSGNIRNILIVYGKVPLFYYLVHWYVIHLLLFGLLLLQGYSIGEFEFGFNFGRPTDSPGLPLWGVYLVWMVVVIALYPLCKKYGHYKQKNSHKMWLRYL